MTMADHRSPAQIEREIEEERRGLTGTLDELQNRFSIDHMTTEAGHFVRTQSGEIAGALSRAVRENPMAIALTGIGIAWMILGNRRNGNGTDARGYGHDAYGDDSDFDDEDDTAYAYRSSRRSSSGAYGQGTGGRTFSDTLRDEDPDWVRGYADVLGSSDSTSPSHDDEGASTADRMREGFERAGERMRDGAESRIDSARRRLGSLRERLAHGTEEFSEDSRRRVLAARERAMEARHEIARQWDSRTRSAMNAYDRQPLAAGALAFAAGAAVAAALPRTRIEDDYMGEQSDRLLEEAERVFQEERGKLGRVVEATAEEAKAVMSEKAGEAKDGMKSLQEEARDATQRVAKKAKDEAERQNLGKPGA